MQFAYERNISWYVTNQLITDEIVYIKEIDNCVDKFEWFCGQHVRHHLRLALNTIFHDRWLLKKQRAQSLLLDDWMFGGCLTSGTLQI